ncbi:MAG: S26 family signal peptidase [Halosimplex sp.]
MSPSRDEESPAEESTPADGTGPDDDSSPPGANGSDATDESATADRPDPGAASEGDADRDRETAAPADTPGESETDEHERAPSTDRVAANGAGTDEPVGRPPARGAETEERSDGALRTFVVDVASSALAVLLVGTLLFAVSGVWPPMVAVESPSMTPHMQTGDLVFVMDEHRFPGEGAVAGTGVVTLHSGKKTAYTKFEKPGDVIVYRPDGSESATPIIHRAMFYVEKNENWYDEADRQSVGRYSECGETPDEAMPYCPAPHAGFITKGDANGGYDQVSGLSSPVRPEWVVGTAELRVPKLGCIRLRQQGCLGGVAAVVPAGVATASGPSAADSPTVDPAVPRSTGNRTAENSAGNRTAVAP